MQGSTTGFVCVGGFLSCDVVVAWIPRVLEGNSDKCPFQARVPIWFNIYVFSSGFAG